MSNIIVEVAAATAVVGYDLCVGKRNASREYPRTIVGIGLAGSAAAGDTEVMLKIGGEETDTQRNTRTGLNIDRDDLIAKRIPVEANEQIQVVVTDAPVTNPVLLQVEIMP